MARIQLCKVSAKLRGFTNLHIKPEEVYTGQLEFLAGQVIDATFLSQSGLIRSPFVKVKLLVGKGELTKKVSVVLPVAVAVPPLQLIRGSRW